MLRTLLFCLITCSATAQTLIPYLGKNGLYGFADTTGKVVVPPRHAEFAESARMMNGYYSYSAGRSRQFLLTGEELTKSGSIDIFNNALLCQPNINHPEDTLYQIIYLIHGDSITLVHLGNQRNLTFKGDRIHSCGIGLDNHHASQESRFECGYLRVHDGEGFNLLDTNLNKVFTVPVSEVSILDAQTALVGNGAGKVAIFSTNGKALTGFDWDLLTPLGKTQLYVTDSFTYRCNFPAPTGPVGVVNRVGQVVIPAQYKSVRLVGNQGLLVNDSAGFSALFNLSGKMILPFKTQRIEGGFEGRLFVSDESGMRLINMSGKTIVGSEYKKIEYGYSLFKYKEGAGFFYGIKPNNILDIFDEEGRVVFSDSMALSANCEVIQGRRFYLLGKRSGKLKNQPSLDFIHQIFNEHFKPVANGIQVKDVGHFKINASTTYLSYIEADTHLIGLCDAEGKEILPAQFEDISTNKSGESDFFFARTKGSLWQFYKLDGTKMPVPPSISPDANARQHEKKYEVWNRNIVMADGRTVPIHNRYGLHQIVHIAESSNGVLVSLRYNYNDTIDVLNEKGNSIIPDGYKVCSPIFNSLDMQRTGLVAVVSKNYAFQTKGTDTLIHYGIIDAKGNWVIEPTRNKAYRPYSYHLIGAYDPAELIQYKGKPKQLHVVNHAKPRIIDVLNVEGFENEGARSILVNVPIKFSTGHAVAMGDKHDWRFFRQGWFDMQGNQMTEFNYTNGPENLDKSWLLMPSFYHNSREYTLLNSKGEVIKKFNWVSNSETSTGFYYGYCVLQNQKNEWCLMDSTGAIVLPFRNEKLNFNLGLVTETSSDPRATQKLMYPNGTVIVQQFHALGRSFPMYNTDWEVIDIQMEPEAKQAATGRTTNQTLVLDAQKKVRHIIPNFQVNEVQQRFTKRYYLIGHTDTVLLDGKPIKQMYVIDAETGKVFREE